MLTPKEQAQQFVQRVGLADERGLAVVEGLATKHASNFDDVVGDLVPGASLLVKRHRRVILVTSKAVYLYAGTIQRPGSRLGSYELGTNQLAFDSKALSLPDGQRVFATKFQADTVLRALGGGVERAFAEKVLREAGDPSEEIVIFATVSDAATSRKDFGERAIDGLFGDWSSSVHEDLFLITTRSQTLLTRVGRLDKPVTVIGVYPAGSTVGLNDTVLNFPDGRKVQFRSPDGAKRYSEVLL